MFKKEHGHFRLKSRVHRARGGGRMRGAHGAAWREGHRSDTCLFPVAAVTNHRYRKGLKNTHVNGSRSWSSEILRPRCVWAVFFRRSEWKTDVLTFSASRVTCCPWLLTPSSSFKVRSTASSDIFLSHLCFCLGISASCYDTLLSASQPPASLLEGPL